ncbi:type II secretion system protein N, partial [Pseudomonas aeruginosa]
YKHDQGPGSQSFGRMEAFGAALFPHVRRRIPSEDRSAALIAVAGRSQRFLPGAEVRPGTVLLAVHRDHVVLRDQGYEERLYFPKAEGAETTHATL